MPLTASVIGVVGTQTLLCQHGMKDELKSIVMKIMPQIPRHDSKMSYEYTKQDIFLHYTVENKVIYLVVNAEDNGRRIPFTFLQDIKQKFKKEFAGEEDKYPDTDALSEDQCRRFNPVLKDRLVFCNDKDQIKTIQQQIEEVKDIMVKNIDSVIERGDKIDNLVEKSTELDAEAGQFRKQAKTLKNKMWWRNIRLIIGIVFLVIVIIMVILMIACNPDFSKC
eukprot:TRINITY_DN13133_c2_g1_i1.p1 TRINITY_DN13133_c2_g1~~TRINITY_DN13133_c2_g1_i1.p1  ORF type:complete len:241 (+),score=74.31 TRINITY_DN13133_c2_g1_i1:59-724(+)